MRRAVRFIAIGIVLVHGLVHLMGAAKGFGWIDVSALKEPIGTAAAFAWLVAAILVVCSAALLAFGVRWWWIIGAVGAVASQAVIVTSWRDAKAGSIANAILLLAALHGFLAEGPSSLRSRYRQLAALRRPAVVGATAPLVTEGDLARLPASVARYVAASGAVGQPRVHGFCALFHGRIRPAADKPWMHCTGEQVNTYGRAPSRLFSMDATMAGIPVDVLHEYSGTSATMRVKACSAITMVDASGPEMDQAETVTLLNDLCVLSPAALVDAPIAWKTIDEHHTEATFTNGRHTVQAVLVFDEAQQLVDFVSDDRYSSSADGKVFTPERWSTPISGYRQFGKRRIGATGAARWCRSEATGDFVYLEFFVDDITYDESSCDENAELEAVVGTALLPSSQSLRVEN